MSRVLAGKLAIITGGSRGIGAAIADNLASKGANVVLGYTSASSQAGAQAHADLLAQKHSVQAAIVQADIGVPNGPSDLIAAAKSAFGHADGSFQIDILVNNAGVARNDRIENVKVADFTATYAVNVLGPLLLVQAALPYLPHDRSGRIVSLSSVSSTSGFVGQSVYGGSKAAIEAMTRTWARELSERCTVNAINPGPVEGPMYESNTEEFKEMIRPFIEAAPLMKARPGADSEAVLEYAKTAGGRPAYTSEIAGIVGMLCTPDAAWGTGQVVSANGGFII
ncbi:L-xylulose reductase [Ceratocystis fimbriata CBS 114723]|uniref:L-xylulose reductase n=1 Tax=Ceratocystis fimbriata CBS 114723 TaxID=1035309 RepID=A0A2C5X2F8_9PEZI|nr:L-xylulose reductase [Ceratocystis fimbriata CBS 114723]